MVDKLAEAITGTLKFGNKELGIASLKKAKKTKKDKRLRIIVSGSVGWKNKVSIQKVLKKLNHKTIEFVATGTAKGADLFTVSACKALGIPLHQIHPWTWYNGSASLSCGKAVSIYKPNLIILFDDGKIENKLVSAYERLAKRKDIELLKVKK